MDKPWMVKEVVINADDCVFEDAKGIRSMRASVGEVVYRIICRHCGAPAPHCIDFRHMVSALHCCIARNTRGEQCSCEKRQEVAA